jgi:hypothetical protein
LCSCHRHDDPDVRARLRRIAADLDLIVTGSSDYPGRDKVDHELGGNTTVRDQIDTRGYRRFEPPNRRSGPANWVLAGMAREPRPRCTAFRRYAPKVS